MPDDVRGVVYEQTPFVVGGDFARPMGDDPGVRELTVAV